jgi:hypothetical protein
MFGERIVKHFKSTFKSTSFLALIRVIFEDRGSGCCHYCERGILMKGAEMPLGRPLRKCPFDI